MFSEVRALESLNIVVDADINVSVFIIGAPPPVARRLR